tara:strand:- start:12981 stop:13463 length:483 start_codon:yes stop_codon:yes gene_type:complete
MSSNIRNLIFIWSVFLLSILLTIIPLPDLIDSFRLPWLMMAVIYFSIFNVSLIGIVSAWLSGLILDLMGGGLMGEHAMILSILSYLSYRFRFQIRVYPIWQIIVVVFLLLCLGELISVWIQGFSGNMRINIIEWINIGIAAILWPIFMGFIQKMESIFIE